jgi:hypothetical protein
MSAGSGASNLGYANINPYNTSPYVNGTSSNYSGSFSSNEIPGTPPGPLPGLAGAKSNIDAAAGRVPGICLFKGGAKKLKRKIKNITKHYKRMKAGSKRIRSMKMKLRRRASSKRMALSRGMAGGKRSRKRRAQKGGYSQYQNNLPLTPVYKVAGINLPSTLLSLANPPPITPLSTCANCVDNYNHFTNMGFPSKGH